MKIWNILLSLVPWISLTLSVPSKSEGSDEEPPRESTNLKLVWLDDLTMSLHLPNTTQLTLLLSPASNIPGEPTPCLFSGTVDQDQRSVVAVTGCKESPETDVTIASRLVPGGLVDLVIINGNTYGIKKDTSSTRDRTLGAGDDCLDPPADPHSSQHQMAAGSAMPKQVVLKTYMRYDNTLLGKFGGSHTSTKQWLSRVVEMARPRLVHSSLSTGLHLQLTGEMKHCNEDIKADKATIYRLARNPKEKGLTSYFGYDLLLVSGTVGIAYRGTACRQDGFAVNINELYSSSNTEVRTARTWVHELGHNIGMRHDFDATHGGESGPCNNQGLMSYGNSPDRWSTCSNKDFADWFRREGNSCLKSKLSGDDAYCGRYKGHRYEGTYLVKHRPAPKCQSDNPLVFEPRFYLAKYVDLQCAFIKPGYDTYTMASKHWCSNGLREGRHGVGSFNRAAYESDANKSMAHFIGWGRNESIHVSSLRASPSGNDAYCGRYKGHRYAGTYLVKHRPAPKCLSDNPLVFEPRFYLAKYMDLQCAFIKPGYDTYSMASKHWCSNGAREGRQGVGSFNSKQYLARYSDLRRAYGSDTKKAVDHFIRWGFKEGRKGK